MLRVILAATGLAAAFPGACVAQSITISPLDDTTLEALKVEIELAGDSDGTTQLTLPGNWGPESGLENLFSGFAATSAGSGPVGLTIFGNDVELTHAPGASLTFSYEVRQDYVGEPQWGVQRVPGMRPVLQPDYATLIGHTWLPNLENAAVFCLAVEGLPPGKAGFSLPLEDGKSEPASLETLKDTILVLGDFRLASSGNVPAIRTAIRAGWAIDDPAIASTARAVLDEAGSLFHDQPFDDYFVAITALPDLPEGSTVIGTGLTESFFILATQNADAANLQHTIVHEVLHEWITRRMGATDEETDPLRMWFTEGFTEYYTQVILLKSGLISLDGFLGNLNKLAGNYQASPFRAATNEEILEGIWDSHEMERLPYQRGALLALHWDSLLRQTSDTRLADAIASLIADADETLSDEEITGALTDILGQRFVDDLEYYITKGSDLPLASLTLPSCLEPIAGKDGIISFRKQAEADAAQCAAEITDAGAQAAH